MRAIQTAFLVAVLLASVDAQAATLSIDIHDSAGKPAPNAVVSLYPDSAIAPQAPEKSVIDQRHETFLPLVVVVRKGGHVIFTNNDTTMHQVYSFSPIKQFQFVIPQGQVAQPVEFPQTGIAAIGCNIHDQMIAYVFVADAPYAAVTDSTSHLSLDVREGHYRVAVWHPQMGPTGKPIEAQVNVGGSATRFASTVPIAIQSGHGMKHMHMDY
jgi:plastocyanin